MGYTDEERVALERVWHTHRRGVNEILADRNLSLSGQQKQAARNFLRHQAEINKIKAAAAAREEREQTSARRKAFGLSPLAGDAHALARRDAMDRIKDATPGEAGRLLEDALIAGDSTMIAAIGQKAWQQSGELDVGGHWLNVLSRFADSSQARREAVGTLAGIKANEMSRGKSLGDRMLGQLSRPDIIARGDVNAMADWDDADE